MRKLSVVLLASIWSGCAARLTQDSARDKIRELTASSLDTNAIVIRRIAAQNENEAIAETTVSLAFQFKRDPKTQHWDVASMRLGDRDWLDVRDLLAAVAEYRSKTTRESLSELADAIDKYVSVHQALPAAADISALTDVLHPKFMTRVIRDDAWGHPLEFEPQPQSYRVRSSGMDGRRNTADDIVVERSRQ